MSLPLSPRWAILFALLLGTAGAPAAETQSAGVEAALPTLAVSRVDRDLVLSGKADDPVWQQAAVITLADADTGAAPHLATAVHLLDSQKQLNVAFVCAADTVSATLTKHDDPLCTGGAVQTRGISRLLSPGWVTGMAVVEIRLHYGDGGTAILPLTWGGELGTRPTSPSGLVPCRPACRPERNL